jgi:hypothetical protein
LVGKAGKGAEILVDLSSLSFEEKRVKRWFWEVGN